MPDTSLPTIAPSFTTSPAGLAGFAVHVGFDGGRAIIGVHGDVDVASAPTLRLLLHTLVDDGHHHLVLDLAATTFTSAAALGVIVGAVARVKQVGGDLTLRSVPPHALRLLGITRLIDSVEIEGSDGKVDLRVALAFAASLPARTRTLDGHLAVVVAVAGATIEGADGVSVTLQRNGRPATVASSNDTVLRMDAHQYETGEGPCLSAASEGKPFHITSLADEDRWPAFVPLAIDEGIASVLSSPIVVGGRPIGALNIYSNLARAFGPFEHDLATILADQAARILTDAPTFEPDDDIAGRVSEALQSRLVLAQAQGVLMARHHLTAEAASNDCNHRARTAGISVLEYAAQIVASTHDDLGPLDRLGSG